MNEHCIHGDHLTKFFDSFKGGNSKTRSSRNQTATILGLSLRAFKDVFLVTKKAEQLFQRVTKAYAPTMTKQCLILNRKSN